MWLTLAREISIADPAYESFNNAPYDQSKVLSVGDHQYTVYWDDGGRLTLCRRNLGDETLDKLAFPATLTADDSHRNVVLGVSNPDGRLHLFFDHHDDDCQWYRSVPGFTSAPPTSLTTAQFYSSTNHPDAAIDNPSVTYPRLFNDCSGTLYCVYRSGSSGNGDSLLFEFDSGADRWQRIGRTHTSEGYYDDWADGSSRRSAYFHDWTFDSRDRLHVTWTWRETWQTWASNHDLCYAYSDNYGRTFYDTTGNRLADLTADDPISIDDDGHVVVEIPTNAWLINQGAQTIDSKDRPHVFTIRSTVRTEDQDHRSLHYVHYWREESGTFHESIIDVPSIRLEKTEIEPTKRDSFSQPILNRDHLVIGPSNDCLCYMVVDGRLYCAHATADGRYDDWTIYALDTDPIIGFDGRKCDGPRWRSDGVLSVPLERPGENGSRKFVLREYESTECGVPERPSLLVRSISSGAIELEWTVAKRATGYTLVRTVDDERRSVTRNLGVRTFSTRYTDTPPQSGCSITYRLAAVNDAGSSVSDPVRIDVPG